MKNLFCCSFGEKMKFFLLQIVSQPISYSLSVLSQHRIDGISTASGNNCVVAMLKRILFYFYFITLTRPAPISDGE